MAALYNGMDHLQRCIVYHDKTKQCNDIVTLCKSTLCNRFFLMQRKSTMIELGQQLNAHTAEEGPEKDEPACMTRNNATAVSQDLVVVVRRHSEDHWALGASSLPQ